MSRERKKEISANLARAKESVRAAKGLAADGFFDFAASRAYYAVFYAATAALLLEGFGFGKHSGVISAFHKQFIKTGKLDIKYGKDLNWLFELRGIGDYGEMNHVPASEANRAIISAEAFVKAVKTLIDA